MLPLDTRPLIFSPHPLRLTTLLVSRFTFVPPRLRDRLPLQFPSSFKWSHLIVLHLLIYPTISARPMGPRNVICSNSDFLCVPCDSHHQHNSSLVVSVSASLVLTATHRRSSRIHPLIKPLCNPRPMTTLSSHDNFFLLTLTIGHCTECTMKDSVFVFRNGQAFETA